MAAADGSLQQNVGQAAGELAHQGAAGGFNEVELRPIKWVIDSQERGGSIRPAG